MVGVEERHKVFKRHEDVNFRPQATTLEKDLTAKASDWKLNVFVLITFDVFASSTSNPKYLCRSFHQEALLVCHLETNLDTKQQLLRVGCFFKQPAPIV